MRTLIVTAFAALTLSLAWPLTDGAAAKSQQARSYNACEALADARGWTRNSKGERQFIRQCMRGKIG